MREFTASRSFSNSSQAGLLSCGWKGGGWRSSGVVGGRVLGGRVLGGGLRRNLVRMTRRTGDLFLVSPTNFMTILIQISITDAVASRRQQGDRNLGCFDNFLHIFRKMMDIPEKRIKLCGIDPKTFENLTYHMTASWQWPSLLMLFIL